MPRLLEPFLRSLGLSSPHFSGGITPDMHKITADSPIESCPLAPVHIVPLKQHIGEASTPLVTVGEHVLRGQKIGKSQGYLSVPVHAPTSGKVVKIEEHCIPHPSGLGMPCIFIEPDGEERADESLVPIHTYRETDPVELRERIRLAGIAGLGGAVFPTFIKLLRDQRHPIETVILNGIECEPYLTNDHRLMLEKPEAVITGLDIVMHMVGAARGIIAIEDNKPEAAKLLQSQLARMPHAENISIEVLPTRYPQGSEKQLIQALTGKEVPAGKLPMHIGIICQNVGTARAIHDAVLLGQPLIERIVTISGDAVPNPGNVRVRLGTPMRFAFAQRGLFEFDGTQLIHGGPMMGERLKSADVPVVKSSTGLLALHNATVQPAHRLEQPCIRCGHCSEACPANLVPNLLADHCRNENFDKAEGYNLFDCIECGSCSYVCPSHIPLVHYFRFGKGQIAQIRREQHFAEESRQRSEAREARIEREKEKRASKRRKMLDAIKESSPEGARAVEEAAKGDDKPATEGDKA